ncbi:restriction endonuclease subunit S [Georgenia muralis]
MYRDYGVVERGFTDDNWNFLPDDVSKYQLVEPGDIVVNKMKAWQGSLGVSSVRGVVSPAYFVYAPTRAGGDTRFLNYLLRSQPLIESYQQMSDGVRVNQWDLDPWGFSRLLIPSPVPATQVAIADYLDRETAQIDALIEKQRALIARLRERRVATIRLALTRGLSQGVRTRTLDIPLISEVPAHWKTIPTRYVCRVGTGSEDSGNADPQGRYPFFVRGREILRIDSYGFDGEAVLTPGDGQGGTGKVFHYTTGKFQAHQRVYVFSDFRHVLGKYFFYWLSTFLQPVALAGSYTVTMESLRRPLLTSFPVVVPPIDEQLEILEYVERETAKIDGLLAKAERFIELARERRAALITAAVTGQIDLTEAGAS